MAIARVVTFEGINKAQMEEMTRKMREGEAPEGLPASELVVLRGSEDEKSLVIVFFDNEDDYERGDEVLNAMPADETPGRRTSVTRYDVAIHMTPTRA
jgi:hypothetical protein